MIEVKVSKDLVIKENEFESAHIGINYEEFVPNTYAGVFVDMLISRNKDESLSLCESLNSMKFKSLFCINTGNVEFDLLLAETFANYCSEKTIHSSSVSHYFMDLERE